MAHGPNRTSFPEPGDHWMLHDPAALGMDAHRLADAVMLARTAETTWPHDLAIALRRASLDREPQSEIVGPLKPRGAPSGVILRHGSLVAEWGDTRRVDVAFSITKSYLSAVAGLAVDQGLIQSIDDPVRISAPAPDLESPHNRAITWRHLLQQTSEWDGSLWGKRYDADRQSGQPPGAPLAEPGTSWAYNDVRVNRLALALLHVWRKPLPAVLRERLMDPIGASPSWQWHGYRNSWVTIDGVAMQSVSGGAHWGGGLWASAYDHARFGHLYLRRGRWRERQILSEAWIERSLTPCPIKPTYGYLWWLNADRQLYRSAPERSFFAIGGNQNVIWVEPAADLVVVFRWLAPEAHDELIGRIMAALR